MLTPEDFDATFEQLAKGLLENRKASQRLFRSTTQAQQEQQETLHQAEENYKRALTEASDKLSAAKNALRDGQAIIQKARLPYLREQPSKSGVTGTNDNVDPLLGLDQAKNQAQTSLQGMRNSIQELERIREVQRRRQHARQNACAVILLLNTMGIAIIFAGIYGYSRYTEERQKRNDMTSTVVALRNSTSVQLTNAVNAQATVQQANQYTATAEANIRATQQSVNDATATIFALQNPTSNIESIGGDSAGDFPTRTPIPSSAFFIAPGESRQMELGPGQAHRWTLYIGTEQRVSIEVIAGNFGRPDAYLEVYDTNERLIANDDDSAGSLNPRIAILPVRPNTQYTVVVSSRNNSSGTYIISVDQIN